MRYRLTVLTPLLVGDGRALSPIDYMVWKDQVNVLDQERIFRLLARGPRLDPYLTQLRRAEKLDFASWGGFAQNFAGRRIPFEHSSLSAIWQQAPAELLHIPTFSSGTAGPFVPGSAIKGALRTGYLFTRWDEGLMKEIADRSESDRGLRRPGPAAESMTAGASADPMRVLSVGDSMPVARSQFVVYLLRVAKLQQRAQNSWELGWKQAPRGTAPGNRPELGTPAFAEMAVPGTEFAGSWAENAFLRRPEIARALHWKSHHDSSAVVASANRYAEHLVNAIATYAASTKLARLVNVAGMLRNELEAARAQPNSCLLNLGWGAGFLSKSAAPNPGDENHRRILRQLPFYAQAIKTGLPFPKSRRIIFQAGEPATVPGWVRLDIAS